MPVLPRLHLSDPDQGRSVPAECEQDLVNQRGQWTAYGRWLIHGLRKSSKTEPGERPWNVESFSLFVRSRESEEGYAGEDPLLENGIDKDGRKPPLVR